MTSINKFGRRTQTLGQTAGPVLGIAVPDLLTPTQKRSASVDNHCGNVLAEFEEKSKWTRCKFEVNAQINLPQIAGHQKSRFTCKLKRSNRVEKKEPGIYGPK